MNENNRTENKMEIFPSILATLSKIVSNIGRQTRPVGREKLCFLQKIHLSNEKNLNSARNKHNSVLYGLSEV